MIKKGKERAARTYTLRNVASVVFALMAVIPLLLFAYTLYALDKLRETQALLGLGGALVFALIGLYLFSNVMGRLSEVLRYLEESEAEHEAAAQAAAVAQPGVTGGSAEPLAAAAGAGLPGVAPAPRFAPPTAPRPAARPTGGGGIVVPGLGAVRSGKTPAPAGFDTIQKSMWKTEAQPHLGRKVLVSVKNAPEPLSGSLAQITDDGILLDHEGQRLAVSYLRITNIEADKRSNA